MNAGEYSHWHMPRIVTDKHLIDLEDGAQPLSKCFGRNMCKLEINLVFTADAFAFQTNLKDLTRCDVTRNEVSIRRIFVFEEIPSLAFRDLSRTAVVAFALWYPNTPTLAAGRFAHQTKLVLAGY